MFYLVQDTQQKIPESVDDHHQKSLEDIKSKTLLSKFSTVLMAAV